MCATPLGRRPASFADAPWLSERQAIVGGAVGAFVVRFALVRACFGLQSGRQGWRCPGARPYRLALMRHVADYAPVACFYWYCADTRVLWLPELQAMRCGP
jgi:hypothetical protein